MTNKPKDSTISKLLSATKYNLKLDNDQLSAFESQERLQPLFDWFALNVTNGNCVTSDELKEFKILQEKGEALYGEELDTALAAYHDQSVESLVPFAGSFNNTLCDEMTHLKEQLHLKKTLLSVVRTSTSAVQDDMCNIHRDLRQAEAVQINVLKNLLALDKMFSAKLVEVEKILCELQRDLSELDGGSEISADEGIDTLTSDALNISTTSISSTMPLQSTCSSKISHKNYLCQLPFTDHGKQQKQFSRLMEGIMHKLYKYIEKCENVDQTVEPELEMKYIMDRLFLQKESQIKSLATIEGITAALNKIKELKRELQSGSWNSTLVKLRESADLEPVNNDLEESFDKGCDDLSEACKKWAEFQTLKPILNKLEENIECSNHLIGKLNEIIDALKMKVAADTVLCDVLLFEADRVSESVKLSTSLQGMIKQRLEAAKERLEVMEGNCRDYADYCSLPVEERSELVEWLAVMLGTEKSSVVEASIALTKNPQQRLQLLCQHGYEQIQTLHSVEHNMKEFCNKEILNQDIEQSRNNSDLLMSVQKALDEMSREIQDTIIYCRSLQENGKSEEEQSEVEEMLKKLLNNNKEC